MLINNLTFYFTNTKGMLSIRNKLLEKITGSQVCRVGRLKEKGVLTMLNEQARCRGDTR